MDVLPLNARLVTYLQKRDLTATFNKKLTLFRLNPLHPSLGTEILEPKHLRIYSFRITKSYRAVFIYCGSNLIEIIDINNHYQ